MEGYGVKSLIKKMVLIASQVKDPNTLFRYKYVLIDCYGYIPKNWALYFSIQIINRVREKMISIATSKRPQSGIKSLVSIQIIN